MDTVISDQSLIVILFGIVISEIGLVVAICCLAAVVDGVRKAVNKNFSIASKDIQTLDRRTQHLKIHDPVYKYSISLPEPTQRKDYTR